MARAKKRQPEKAEISIAPMIDMVFLLLIYFMVTSSLEPQEADISFQLPGLVEQSDPLDIPDEQIIEIRPNGQVVVNESEIDSPEAPRFRELAAMLNRYRQASEANKVEAIVTIAPADGTRHAFIVKVMDACARAQITNVNFSIEEEE